MSPPHGWRAQPAGGRPARLQLSLYEPFARQSKTRARGACASRLRLSAVWHNAASRKFLRREAMHHGTGSADQERDRSRDIATGRPVPGAAAVARRGAEPGGVVRARPRARSGSGARDGRPRVAARGGPGRPPRRDGGAARPGRVDGEDGGRRAARGGARHAPSRGCGAAGGGGRGACGRKWRRSITRPSKPCGPNWRRSTRRRWPRWARRPKPGSSRRSRPCGSIWRPSMPRRSTPCARSWCRVARRTWRPRAANSRRSTRPRSRRWEPRRRCSRSVRSQGWAPNCPPVTRRR